MALIHAEHFDNMAYANLAGCGYTFSGSSGDITFPAGRFGNCYQSNNNTISYLRYFFADKTTIVQSVAVKFAELARWPIVLLDGANAQLSIGVDASARLSVCRGGGIVDVAGTTLGNSPGAVIVPGVWYWIEVKATINGTTGSVIVRVNNIEVINLSNVNTQATANTRVTGVCLTAHHALAFDDWIINDTTGATFNDFPGDCRVWCLVPNGDSATNNAWTQSTGANKFGTVDEAAVNGDTDYCYSNTVGQRQGFTHAAANIPGTIRAVGARAWVRKTDAGNTELSTSIRHGGVDYDGTGIGMSTSYVRAGHFWEVDPSDSSAWNGTKVDALEFGVLKTV